MNLVFSISDTQKKRANDLIAQQKSILLDIESKVFVIGDVNILEDVSFAWSHQRPNLNVWFWLGLKSSGLSLERFQE